MSWWTKTTFICEECEPKIITPEQTLEHLRMVHRIEEPTGTERMLMCLDGAKGYYKRVYECDCQGVKLTKTIEGGMS